MKVDVTKGQVLRYTLTPEVMPRIHDFVGQGFRQLAFFMAMVFSAVNIIPQRHPYLNPANFGNYGLRDVLALASGSLEFKKSNIDKVIVFFAIIAALVILAIQFFLLLMSFLINPVLAQSSVDLSTNFFVTKNPKEDIAFRLLDRVFGIKGMFKSVDDDSINTFHDALHGLLQFYSIGLLVIAVFIAIYFVFAIVAETAQTGTPFGRRFNHVWAPIRLVVAIGLLVPIGQGLNSAQWITMYAAKFGSSFATNGWIKFNDVLMSSEETYLGKQETLVATPNAPEVQQLGAFMMIVKTCKIINEKKYPPVFTGRTIDAYLVKDPREGQGKALIGTDYKGALEYSNKEDIRIRFGQLDPTKFPDDKGYVKPWCGEILLQTTSVTEDGAYVMQQKYYDLISQLWSGGPGPMTTLPENYVKMFGGIYGYTESNLPTLQSKDKATIQDWLQSYVTKAIEEAVKKQKETKVYKEGDENNSSQKDLVEKYGWGGAGIWYNKIAQVNGDLIAATSNVPRPYRMPWVMEEVSSRKLLQNRTVPSNDKYNRHISGADNIELTNVGDNAIADTLNNVYKDWITNGLRGDKLAAHTAVTGSIMVDVINLIFGTQGLFDMCKNADIHPLAQLSALGKGILEASIRNLGGGTLAGALGGIFSALDPHIGGGLDAASSFLVTVGTVGLVVGFILFYIVPFLPFLYFFFAVGGWVKGLFEALVGVPLWALAHLRIDGEGLPGDAALGGYFLIFEVFVRPIMIIFGLIASAAIFGALVKVLNDIFSLVVSNLSGFDPAKDGACGNSSASPGTSTTQPTGIEYFRGPIDEFFFTIIYAILVYMIGLSCFKMIDLVPNNILRWMGQAVKSFGDEAGEPAEGLIQKMAVGGGAVSSQLKDAAGQGASASKHGLAALTGKKSG